MAFKNDVEFLLGETFDVFGDLWGEIENITPNKPIGQTSSGYSTVGGNGDYKKPQTMQPRTYWPSTSTSQVRTLTFLQELK